MRALRILLWVMAAVLLASCAAPGRIGGAGPAYERVGRFAMSLHEADGTAQAAQGGFSWRDDGRTLRLDLLSPMGGVLARILVEPGHAQLERANGEVDLARNPDALLAEVWGEPMPVAGLRAWIRGQAWAGSPITSEQRDPQGRIVALVQDGWTLRLGNYDAQGPGRLRLSREQGGQRLSLQLIADAP